MTNEKIAELEAMEMTATPKPWKSEIGPTYIGSPIQVIHEWPAPALVRDVLVRCCGNLQPNATNAELIAEMRNSLTDLLAAAKKLNDLHTPRRMGEYHEDSGCVLWWRLPVSEPPYVGDPGCSDWPFDESDEAYLVWTPLPDGNAVHHAVFA